MTLSALLMAIAIQVGCGLCVLMIVAITLWSVWNTVQEGIQHLKQLHQIPCSDCTYFTGDYRLKCTVHPVIALTEDAIACRDYEKRLHTIGQPVILPCHQKIDCQQKVDCSSTRSVDAS